MFCRPDAGQWFTDSMSRKSSSWEEVSFTSSFRTSLFSFFSSFFCSLRKSKAVLSRSSYSSSSSTSREEDSISFFDPVMITSKRISSFSPNLSLKSFVCTSFVSKILFAASNSKFQLLAIPRYKASLVESSLISSWVSNNASAFCSSFLSITAVRSCLKRS